jgi:membrane protease YdiL (CAAX protease family)
MREMAFRFFSWGNGASATGYWTESRQPLASLVFIAPLLVVYELGVVVLGVQTGADVWMRKTLNLLGFGQHLLLPILTAALLLGWHHIKGGRWRVPAGVLPGMLAECLLLAIALRVILQLQKGLFGLVSGAGTVSLADKFKPLAGGFIGYLGAGIYEELLFRLILLSLVLWLLYRLGVPGGRGFVIAAATTSLVFAVAHYVGPYGEQFQAFSFVFRFIAGVFFSVLFVYRGFGIAAGTHAFYDILVGLL